MDPQPYHPRAAITEAVLGIQVMLASDVNLETLALVGSRVEDDYPTRRRHVQTESEWSVGPDVDVTTTTRQLQLGYLYISKDSKQTFQARRDGFTFSRLRPYTKWEQFRSEARKLWELYRATVPVENIIRIGVRYINRLELPFSNGVVDFNDYLKTVPEVSRSLPQDLSSFFLQVLIPIPDISGMVAINEALIPSTEPGIVPVLLDIDLFRTHSIPQDEEGLWMLFEQMRVTKNYIFEECITDKTRRLID
jgi:uncharacterized protein (TIGR04255 family)